MMERDEFELMKEICRQLTRIADVLEVPPVSLRERLEMDLSWLKWCYLFLPSESLKKDIEAMAADLDKMDDEAHTD